MNRGQSLYFNILIVLSALYGLAQLLSGHKGAIVRRPLCLGSQFNPLPGWAEDCIELVNAHPLMDA
jgi:hypothetical protein